MLDFYILDFYGRMPQQSGRLQFFGNYQQQTGSVSRTKESFQKIENSGRSQGPIY
jgi:hypothetical protein